MKLRAKFTVKNYAPATCLVYCRYPSILDDNYSNYVLDFILRGRILKFNKIFQKPLIIFQSKMCPFFRTNVRYLSTSDTKSKKSAPIELFSVIIKNIWIEQKDKGINFWNLVFKNIRENRNFIPPPPLTKWKIVHLSLQNGSSSDLGEWPYSARHLRCGFVPFGKEQLKTSKV